MSVSWPLSTAASWFSNQFINSAKIQANITDPLNDLYNKTAADTGWLAMASLQSGWTNDSTALQARQVGGVVHLVGGIVNASFSTGTFTLAATLPSTVAAPPGTRVYRISRGSSAVTSEVRLLADRSVQVLTSASSGNAFRLDGLYYLTS